MCIRDRINVDEEPELANKFSIMSIPTLVVMKNGKIVPVSYTHLIPMIYTICKCAIQISVYAKCKK